MRKKNKKRNGKIKEIFGFIFSAVLVAAMTIFLPFGFDITIYNKITNSIYILLVLSVIICRISNLVSPNWRTKYLDTILTIPTFGGFLVLKFILASIKSWIWILSLLMMYFFATILPIIDNKLAKEISNELYTPTTRLTRFIVFGFLLLGPAAGFIGVWISKVSQKTGSINPTATIIGFILHAIFVWGQVDQAQRAWKMIPRRR